MNRDTNSRPTPGLVYISVEQALAQVLQGLPPLASEDVPLGDAPGRVLAAEVTAPAELPPFSNSAMDGFAVRSQDTASASQEAPTALAIIGEVRAGQLPAMPLMPGCAIRIMTGAPIPDGSDAVIQVERVQQTAEHVLLHQPAVLGENIRPAGGDMRQKQVLFEVGHTLRPTEIGVLAAIGCAQVEVTRRPRVAILSTGDELVAIDQTPTSGQIRNSNEAAVAALVRHYGGVPLPLGIARDTHEALEAKIQLGLEQSADMFVTSAGVSVGDYDIVKDVLSSQGNMVFWKVAMKPGKPLAFGQVRGIPWLGLPGNPVSCVISCEIFVRPAVLKMLGRRVWEKPAVTAMLDEAVTNSGRRHYMRGYVRREADGYHVSIRASDDTVQGSSLLSSLIWANGLAVIPELVDFLPAGSQVQVHMLDWPENVF